MSVRLSLHARRRPGILDGLAALLGLALAGWGLWWLGGRLLHFYGNLDHPLRASLLTALGCCALLALAAGRRDRVRCVRFQRRAETYEAALGAILQCEPVPQEEWQAVRARLLLWGSRDVVALVADLERCGSPPDLTRSGDAEALAGLVHAMRRELGQGSMTPQFKPGPAAAGERTL